jgi:hypothetical protein
VLAADERAPGVPDCTDDRLCRELHDRFGLDALRMRLEQRSVAEGIRTPLPLPTAPSGAATGVR